MRLSAGDVMRAVNLKDAESRLSSLVDAAAQGKFVTIIRYGKPVAVLMSVEAGEIAREMMKRKRPGLVAYLRTFPGGAFERNASPSRDSAG